jgi:hypothetical protein
MSRWNSSDERRIRRALVVDEFGAVSWDKYLRHTSRADPTEVATT